MEKEDINGTVVIIPRISHFIDDNGNNVDICAAGGKRKLNPIYVI